MQEQPQQTSLPERMRGVAGWISFLSSAVAVSIEVVLHRGFGARYLGFQAAAAALLIPAFGVFFPHGDLRPLLVFWGFFLLMCLVARLGILRRRWRGERDHSRYNGWPRLLRPSATASQERRMKLFWEPALVFLAGGMTHSEFNQPLGAYLILGAICLVISNGLIRMWENNRTLDLQDAMYEQQANAERFRALHGR